MALSTTTATTVQAAEAPVAPQSSFPTSETALLLMGALAGASMTKAARKQYRKMTRKATWKMMGYKFKSMLGLKQDVPDTVMGINFWLFIALVVVGAAIGFALFEVAGFLILLGIFFIIYLLLQD